MEGARVKKEKRTKERIREKEETTWASQASNMPGVSRPELYYLAEVI